MYKPTKEEIQKASAKHNEKMSLGHSMYADEDFDAGVKWLLSLQPPEPAAPVQSAGVTPFQAQMLLNVRYAITFKDWSEAYHFLYKFADPEMCKIGGDEPWEELQSLAAKEDHEKFVKDETPQPQASGVWKLVDKDFKEKEHPNLTLRWTTTKGPDGWFQETHWLDLSESAQPQGEGWTDEGSGYTVLPHW